MKKHLLWIYVYYERNIKTAVITVIFIGVFHAMAGMAAAMPGLKKFPSAGKEIEASR